MRYKMTLYKHEMKVNAKSLSIWTLSVGAICFGCILLYGGLEESVQDIAASFSDMGAMSAALGMDKMSLATLRGYFATEIAMMHGLGGAMFAAILGSGLLSKEESGHTVDFLNVFPIKRDSIVFWKYLSLVSNILLLNLVCSVLYILGFSIMGEEVIVEELLLYGFATSLMQIEIGSVCFLFSAFVKKVTISVGIVPALKKLKYITPFYYSNAADLFTDGKLNGVMAAIGMGVIFISYIAALSVYKRKDL